MVKIGKEEGLAVASCDGPGSELYIEAVCQAHVGEIKGNVRSL